MLNAGDDPEARRLAQAAAQAYGRGDRAAAGDLARQLLMRRPGDGRARFLLGLIALDGGDVVMARRHLDAASAAMPEDPNVANAHGVALRMVGELDAARAAYARAGQRGLIDGWRNLGALELAERKLDASEQAYGQALKLAPRDGDANARLAHIYEARHDLERARAHANVALAADAGNAIAGAALARVLLRAKDYAGAERAALAAAQSQQAVRADRSAAWGLVGDARDLAGDARGAFQAFTAANELRLVENTALRDAEAHLYHPEGVRRMTRLVESADPASWRTEVQSAHPAPVFLIGFPRSGTTLLDQILSSHPQLMCLEETEYLSVALAEVFSDAEKLARMHALHPDDIETVRSAYWREVLARNEIPPGVQVIDKLPLNIVVLPLIKAVFPDAKIIFALRDPRDVVLSCYQQRFGMNVGMAQFLELDRAAAYYDAVMSLMLACRARLSLNLHQVRYEDVVSDLEAAARALTVFLGVPFDAAMLNYRETALSRDIATPSARQVIQPLYARSMARWRRYEADMAPVLPLLGQWAARFGYAD